MRIGLIADALDSKITGISTYTSNLIAALSRLNSGDEFFVIHHSSNPLPSTIKNCHDIIVPTPFYDRNRTVTRTFSFVRSLRKYTFDVLHDLIGSAMWFGEGPINIQTIFDASCFTVPKSHTIVNRIINDYLLRYSIKSVDHFITISKASKNDLQKYLHIKNDQLSITNLAADVRFYKYSAEKDLSRARIILKKFNISQPYILSVGALVARKNIITLLKSFQYLKEHYKIPHKLVLVGVRPVRSKQLTEVFDSYPDIIFTGYVQDEELPALYNLANCFVFPSLYEGFGLPVLEALQCGCPVVVSNISSLPEITGDSALLLDDPMSVNELSRLIISIIHDKNLSRQLTEKGILQAKKFSWERCAQETLHVYHSSKKR